VTVPSTALRNARPGPRSHERPSCSALTLLRKNQTKRIVIVHCVRRRHCSFRSRDAEGLGADHRSRGASRTQPREPRSAHPRDIARSPNRRITASQRHRVATSPRRSSEQVGRGPTRTCRVGRYRASTTCVTASASHDTPDGPRATGKKRCGGGMNDFGRGARRRFRRASSDSRTRSERAEGARSVTLRTSPRIAARTTVPVELRRTITRSSPAHRSKSRAFRGPSTPTTAAKRAAPRCPPRSDVGVLRRLRS
jgi:hypothetical protein